MSFIEKMMKAMTHLNIGAAIAMLAWILWSGQQITYSDVPIAHHASVQMARPTSAFFQPLQSHTDVKP